ncbi:MAG: hypothetical protein ACREBR_01540 [bacterium]
MGCWFRVKDLPKGGVRELGYGDNNEKILPSLEIGHLGNLRVRGTKIDVVNRWRTVEL